MKTTNGKKATKNQIWLAASNFLFNTKLVNAYYKLVMKLNEGKGNDLAANYVKVPQCIDGTSVKDMVEMIESAIKPESAIQLKSNVPGLFTDMNWKLLRKQKGYLLDLRTKNELIEGVVALLDAIQDYAVDTLGISEKKVFGKLNEIE